MDGSGLDLSGASWLEGRQGLSVRAEERERERLEKENFDLKLRLFYAEEAYKRDPGMALASPAPPSSSSAPTSREELCLQLEERSLELEQKNQLIYKAKKAIEGLKAQVERLRSDNAALSAEEGRLVSRERLEELERALDGRLTVMREQLVGAERARAEAQEEATQSRALAEIYHCQLEEQGGAVGELTAAVFEARAEAKDVHARYEAKAAQLKAGFEEAFRKEEQRMGERLAESERRASEAAEALRAAHASELARAAVRAEAEAAALREEHRAALAARDGEAARLTERADALFVARSAAGAELLTARDMLGRQETEIAALVASTAAQNDSIRALKHALELGKNERRANFEFDSEHREELFRLRAELGAAEGLGRQGGEEVARARRECADAARAQAGLEAERARLQLELRDAQVRAGAAADLARENERLSLAAGVHAVEVAALSSAREQAQAEAQRCRQERADALAAAAGRGDEARLLGLELGQSREALRRCAAEAEEAAARQTALRDRGAHLEAELQLLGAELDAQKALLAERAGAAKETDRQLEGARRVCRKLFGYLREAADEWAAEVLLLLEGGDRVRRETGAVEVAVEDMAELAVGALQSVRGHLARLGKVRAHFRSAAAALQASAQSSFSVALDKVSLLELRVGRACVRAEQVGAALERDGRVGARARGEVQELSEALVAESRARLREEQARAADLAARLVVAQEELVEARRRGAAAEAEAWGLRGRCEGMEAELTRFAEAEAAVAALSGRAEALSSAALEPAAGLARRQREEERLHRLLQEERLGRQAQAESGRAQEERLAAQRALLDRASAAAEGSEAELRRLRGREIDPALERVLMQSAQSLRALSGEGLASAPVSGAREPAASESQRLAWNPSADAGAGSTGSYSTIPKFGTPYSFADSQLQTDSSKPRYLSSGYAKDGLLESPPPKMRPLSDSPLVASAAGVSVTRFRPEEETVVYRAMERRDKGVLTRLPMRSATDATPYKRESISRISKLGADLKQLATKLDALDSCAQRHNASAQTP